VAPQWAIARRRAEIIVRRGFVQSGTRLTMTALRHTLANNHAELALHSGGRASMKEVGRASGNGKRPKLNGDLAAQFPGRDRLTPRELEVLELIANGNSNKEAGRLLGISPRTIEVHRAHIMDKTGARNTADLVNIVMTDRH
jgi:DNA-binding CsgD family transcriptional regulator